MILGPTLESSGEMSSEAVRFRGSLGPQLGAEGFLVAVLKMQLGLMLIEAVDNEATGVLKVMGKSWFTGDRVFTFGGRSRFSTGTVFILSPRIVVGADRRTWRWIQIGAIRTFGPHLKILTLSDKTQQLEPCNWDRCQGKQYGLKIKHPCLEFEEW